MHMNPPTHILVRTNISIKKNRIGEGYDVHHLPSLINAFTYHCHIIAISMTPSLGYGYGKATQCYTLPYTPFKLSQCLKVLKVLFRIKVATLNVLNATVKICKCNIKRRGQTAG